MVVRGGRALRLRAAQLISTIHNIAVCNTLGAPFHLAILQRSACELGVELETEKCMLEVVPRHRILNRQQCCYGL
jgi:hypothetical protein